ncbi:cytochrome c oxidase-assembly factor cox-16, mitochondrial [Ramicandelaber brevisporus]|nr:cytochrome c oxidase-assembly factor cox-16, mitochondrial [Ramicandelaber brevisporus]
MSSPFRIKHRITEPGANTGSSAGFNRHKIAALWVQQVRKRPFIFFGLPFIGVIVVGSFMLQSLTNTRYELRAQKVQALSKEDELKISKTKRKLSLQEEYFRLMAHQDENYEMVRVPRPPGED